MVTGSDRGGEGRGSDSGRRVEGMSSILTGGGGRGVGSARDEEARGSITSGGAMSSITAGEVGMDGFMGG